MASSILDALGSRIFGLPAEPCCEAASMGPAAASHTGAAMARIPSKRSGSGVTDTGTAYTPARRPSARKRERCTVAPVAHTLLPGKECIRDPGDPYLPLRDLRAYSGISQRTLREYLKDPVHPLPHYRVVDGGKVLVRRSEFDTWIARFRADSPDVDAIVREVLGDVA